MIVIPQAAQPQKLLITFQWLTDPNMATLQLGEFILKVITSG